MQAPLRVTRACVFVHDPQQEGGGTGFQKAPVVWVRASLQVSVRAREPSTDRDKLLGARVGKIST